MGSSTKLYWIYDEHTQEAAKEAEAAAGEYDLQLLDAESFFSQPRSPEIRVLAHASLNTLKRLLLLAEEEGWALAILPTSRQRYLQKSFGLGTDRTQALKTLATASPKPLDLLFANEEPILFNALVGEAPPLSYRSSLWGDRPNEAKLGLFFRELAKLRSLHISKVILRTAKGITVKTAAAGVVVFGEGGGSYIAKFLSDEGFNDGQLRAMVIAPRSIVSYVYHLLVAIFPLIKPSTLPDSVGVVKSASVEVEADPKLQLIVDGSERGTTPVTFRVHPKAIQLCAPESFWEHNPPTQTDKESLRIAHLPQTEESVKQVQKALPFFAHASEAEYRELFAALRQDAKLQSTYLVLILFSTLLATLGLFLDSASVVIGAMLLAPLMQPIVSFSMGLLRWDGSLSLRAFRTVLGGVGLSLLASFLVAWVMPLHSLTSEMAGRLHPTLLDLSVAIISGMAAAYAKNNPRISGSLVGVAIAVALVPPLATAGIGLGWGELPMFFHAFLLFLTNFVGIVLAAALVFLVQGFSPIHRARRGLRIGIAAALLVAIPLSYSFRQMTEDARILESLLHHPFKIGDKYAEIDHLVIQRGRQTVLRCELCVQNYLDRKEIEAFKAKLAPKIPEKFRLEVIQKISL